MAPPVEKKKKFSFVDHRLISSAAIGEHEQQQMGSLMTSSKMKRPLRKIWICTDVLMDILPFFHHAQLGLKLALLSPRFDVLVDKHFNGKNELTLWRPITIQKDNGMPQLFVMGKSVPFPLPDRPLLNKIRFMDLQIIYIDHSVLAFLRANHQIWDKSGTKLGLTVSAIDKDCPVALENARDDGPNATSADQALSKWLHTPRKDGQPKRLIFRHSDYRSMPIEWIQSFKKAFLCATISSSARYKIHFYVSASTPIVPFELVNERIKQKLTLEKERDFGFAILWKIKCCPIGETTDQWNDEKWDNLNGLFFRFYRGKNCIGPLFNQQPKKKRDKAEKKAPN